MERDRETLKVRLLQHPHFSRPRYSAPRTGYAPVWPVALPGPCGQLNVLIISILGTFGALCYLSARETRDGGSNSTLFSDMTSECEHDHVWVIRHGEKTLQPAPGSREVLELNVTGLSRARFLKGKVLQGLWPRFSHVFASSPVPAGAALREWQTVEPLASALGLTVDLTFSQNETNAIARAALEAARAGQCGDVVLIAWEHCRIPALLMAMGCKREECVRCWPDGAYDAVVALSVSDKGAPDISGATLGREGFAMDVVGYEGYQCAEQERRMYSRCRFPDGTWL